MPIVLWSTVPNQPLRPRASPPMRAIRVRGDRGRVGRQAAGWGRHERRSAASRTGAARRTGPSPSAELAQIGARRRALRFAHRHQRHHRARLDLLRVRQPSVRIAGVLGSTPAAIVVRLAKCVRSGPNDAAVHRPADRRGSSSRRRRTWPRRPARGRWVADGRGCPRRRRPAREGRRIDGDDVERASCACSSPQNSAHSPR